VNKALEVRQITVTAGGNMQSGLSEVIKQMVASADFAVPLRVEELAEQANMSAASPSLKAVTR